MMLSNKSEAMSIAMSDQYCIMYCMNPALYMISSIDLNSILISIC